MILLILICFVIVLSYYRFKRSPEDLKFLEKIPLLQQCYPVIGNVRLFIFKTPQVIFENYHKAFLDHDKWFHFFIGPLLQVAVTHPDHVQKILSHPDCLDKLAYFYDFGNLKDGLITAKHEKWSPHRKALNPSFNRRVLNSFLSIFIECSERCVENMEIFTKSGEDFNMLEYTGEAALEMVVATSTGKNVNELEGKKNFVDSVFGMSITIANRMLNPHHHPDIIYNFTKEKKEYLRCRETIYNFTDKIVADRKLEYLSSVHEIEIDDESDYKKPKIFIEQLWTNNLDGNGFTDEEVSNHVCSLIMAGTETTAFTAAQTFLFLAFDQKIEKKVMDEIKAVFPSEKSEITHEALRQLVYLDMVIKECLRLCPSIPLMGRENCAEITVDGVTFPKGTKFLFDVYAMHRRADFFPDPTKFDPERHSQDMPKNPAFMPYSFGSRNCIGHLYAKIALKTLLVTILRKYKVFTKLRSEDLKYKYEISLKLDGKPIVNIEKRNLYID